LEELKQKHMPQLQVIQDESNSMDKSNQHISKPQRNSVHKETKRELFLYLLRILHQLLMNGGDEAKYFVRDSDSQDHLPDPERSSPIQTNSTTNEANEQQQPRSIQLSLKTKLGFFPFSWTFDFTPISHSATFIRDYLIFPLFAISKELNRQNEILAQFVTERDCLIQEYKQRSETAPCKSLSQSLHFDYEDFLNTHLSSSEFREAISNPLSKFEHASKLIYEKYFLLKDDSQRTVTTDGNFDTLSCPTHDELVLSLPTDTSDKGTRPNITVLKRDSEMKQSNYTSQEEFMEESREELIRREKIQKKLQKKTLHLLVFAPAIMDAQRKLLDALMGTNRNGEKPTTKHFSDPDVCKYFLCGLCPSELFVNTHVGVPRLRLTFFGCATKKMDFGECTKIHSIPMKSEYEEEIKKGKYYGYEEDLEAYLEDFVTECDRKIARAQKRLEETEKEKEDSNLLAAEIKELYARAEDLGSQGKVEESLLLISQAEELKRKESNDSAVLASQDAVTIAAAAAAGVTPSQQQKLRVCDICGALLSIHDSDRRLADHFGGKLHLGYLQIREKLKEIKEERAKAGRDTTRRERERDRHRDKERTRRDRDRESRERDTERDSIRYERSRNKERERDRDRHRDRDREDRSRDRERTKERERYVDRESHRRR
jgi:RNA-binding protein Luc7-like 2